MKVLIIEDEVPAVDHLLNLLHQKVKNIEVLEHLDSVKSAVRWFEEHEPPELAFFDIQLADGKSFEIFEKVQVNCPIIFTTAYDDFALKAFEVNSIDYLLKPITASHLERAIKKFEKGTSKPMLGLDAIQSLLRQSTKKYKEQFLIKVGEHLRTVQTSEIVLFFSEDRTTYGLTLDGKKYILDFTLDQIEDIMDPSDFFRINRKFIIRMDGIKDMVSFSNSRLKVSMKNFESDDMVVSRERVGEFKLWLDR